MRCVQCGYSTFDYLDTCSKCRSDFFEEKARLNLPTGPCRPISLTEILARVGAPAAEVVPAPEAKTEKIKTADFSGPKTFDLDLSQDVEPESASEKWMAKAGGIQGKLGGEPGLDLRLE